MAYGGYMNRGTDYHGKTYVYFATQAEHALYIGMTQCVSTRLKQHKTTSSWFEFMDDIGYITCQTRELAKQIERFLICLHQPIYNTQGK